MNETLNTIYTRRAVRKYKDKPVEKELIEQILDAARMAPSAMNKQPWKFYVITNKQLIQTLSSDIAKKVAEKYPSFAQRKDMIFYGAPVVIFITSPKDNEWGTFDVGICSQNIMLAAKSLGLDTCPIGFAKFIEQTQNLSQLKIPETEKINLAIIIGYANENPQPHPRNKNNTTYIE
jgi:nitroreductase